MIHLILLHTDLGLLKPIYDRCSDVFRFSGFGVVTLFSHIPRCTRLIKSTVCIEGQRQPTKLDTTLSSCVLQSSFHPKYIPPQFLNTISKAALTRTWIRS